MGGQMVRPVIRRLSHSDRLAAGERLGVAQLVSGGERNYAGALRACFTPCPAASPESRDRDWH